MKITAISVNNVMAIREVDVAPKNPIILICGDNDVGKTSLQEAIRFAFHGEIVRVKKKGDWAQVVREGSKGSTVVIEFEHGGKVGRAGRSLPSGKGECMPEMPLALSYALDAPKFAGQDETSRRRFLFDLIGVQANMDGVRQRMEKRGVRDDLIKLVVPMIRAGFDAGEKYAIEQQTQWRANWKAITNESYGEVKADTWTAPRSGAEVNKDEIDSIRKSIETLRSEQRDLNQLVGAGKSFLANKTKFDAESGGLRSRAENLGKAKRDQAAAEKAVRDHRPAVEKLRQKLADARHTGQPCPECGTILGIRDSKIVAVTVTKPKDLAALEADVTKAEAAMRTLETAQAAASQAYTDASSATESLAALEKSVGTPTTAEKLAELEESANEIDKEIAQLEAKRKELEQAGEAAAAAKKATANAKQTHENVKDWGVVRDAVAPTGIPAEILEEAIGPINDRLKKSAETTGWELAQIRSDMEITSSGRLYGLCGESRRWRTDAMLAEAIANAANLKAMMLDRIDVLAPGRRGALLDWCDALTQNEGYETIILSGTLKEKPAIEGFSVYWIKDGRVSS